jgi:hypothetical protein
MRGAVSRAAPVVYLYPNPGYLPRLGASASLARAIITKPMTINTHGFCMAPLFLCYSMIWSARSNSDCGIFRLSALAVLRSCLQLLLQLVQEPPVGALSDQFLRAGFDQPDLVQAQGVKAEGILRAGLAPARVGVATNAGQCNGIDIGCARRFHYSTNGSISPSWPV